MTQAMKYEPNAALARPATIKALFDAQRDQIRTLLPSHIDPDKMLHGVLAAVNKNRKLLECSQSSFIQSLVSASTLGVDISGVTGEAYLIPFKGQVTLQVGYKGMAKLARQSGSVRRIEAEVVRDGDHWRFMKGSNPVLEWSPGTDRGGVIGAYALLEYENGGIETLFMDAGEIDDIRKVSMASARGPWVDWFDEMAKKTALKRLLKLSPMTSDRLVEAIRHDNDQYQPDSRAARRSDDSARLTDHLVDDEIDEAGHAD